MRWLDIGSEARGVVAIGQFATGVVAVGQVASGFIAIGQVAFGFFAIGQVAIGGFTAGMLGVGLYGTFAMTGVGGRGIGLIVRLLPSLGPRYRGPSRVSTVAEVRAGPQGEGWVRLWVEARPDARLAIYEGDERIRDLRLDARIRRAALGAAPGEVWAHLRPSALGPVIDRVQAPGRPRWAEPRWWLIWSAQTAGLVLLAAILWLWVVEPLWFAWWGEGGLLRQ